MNVGKVVGNKINQPAIFKVKSSKSAERVSKLVYDDGGKLHVLHYGGKVSLFDPSTKELILLEAPQEGLNVIDAAISPNADHVVILLGLSEEDKYGRFKKCQTIVKRKLEKTDWKDLFGCKEAERTKS